MAALTIVDTVTGEDDIRETVPVTDANSAGIILTRLWLDLDGSDLYGGALVNFADAVIATNGAESFTVSNACDCGCGSAVEFTYTV